MSNKKPCHCIIKHPTTEKEREQAREALKYARQVGDSLGTMLALARLTGGCPSNPRGQG